MPLFLTKTESRFKALLQASVLVMCAVFLAACNDSEAEQRSDSYHHLAQSWHLQEEDGYRVERRFPGVVRSYQQVQLGFELGGSLQQVLVEQGDEVKRGQLLAKLDTDLLEVARQQLMASQRQANAELHLVRTNRQRLQELKSGGFASQQRFDELDTQEKVLLASLDRLQSELEGNHIHLQKSAAVAPFDGVVGSRLADPGTVVGQGQPVLTLLQSDRWELQAGVPARLLGQLQVGGNYFVDWRGQSIAARLLSVGVDVDPYTRTVPVRFSLPPGPWVNGEMAQLVFKEWIDQSGYWVPLEAVTDGLRGMWNVFLLDPQVTEKPLYQVTGRTVSIHFVLGQRAYVSGDLQTGGHIVAAGTHRIVPGQLVRSQGLEL